MAIPALVLDKKRKLSLDKDFEKIANASNIASSDYMLWNVVSTFSYSLRHTAYSQLGAVKPKEDEFYIVAE